MNMWEYQITQYIIGLAVDYNEFSLVDLTRNMQEKMPGNYEIELDYRSDGRVLYVPKFNNSKDHILWLLKYG